MPFSLCALPLRNIFNSTRECPFPTDVLAVITEVQVRKAGVVGSDSGHASAAGVAGQAASLISRMHGLWLLDPTACSQFLQSPQEAAARNSGAVSCVCETSLRWKWRSAFGENKWACYSCHWAVLLCLLAYFSLQLSTDRRGNTVVASVGYEYPWIYSLMHSP